MHASETCSLRAHTCHVKLCGWTTLCLESNALSLQRTSALLPSASLSCQRDYLRLQRTSSLPPSVSLFCQHGYLRLRRTSSLLPWASLFCQHGCGCSFLRRTFFPLPLVCLFYHCDCSKFLCKIFMQKARVSKVKKTVLIMPYKTK
jgi:hypothetical protein